jgi:hypothetical protein
VLNSLRRIELGIGEDQGLADKVDRLRVEIHNLDAKRG